MAQKLQLATKATTKPQIRSRCEEIRRRVSWGVVDYAKWDGDPELQELIKPIFVKKRLVIWSLDHHPAPLYDIRSLVEPLGVEFIEHSVYHQCQRTCSCDDFKALTPLQHNDLLEGLNSQETIDRIYHDPLSASDVARADAFLSAYSYPLVELYMRYNRSIIIISAIRYNLWVDGPSKWSQLSDRLHTLFTHPRHVIGANNLYDVEYLHYFLGSRPDYVPSFAGYTGEHYNPTRQSFLYSYRVFEDIGDYWNVPFQRQYQRINATFRIDKLQRQSKFYEHSDLAAYLGIVQRPYAVSVIYI